MPKQKKPKSIVGLGYAIPYLNIWKHTNPIALMPARQGAIRWPAKNPSKTALADETNLPLEKNSIDLFILIHILEFTQHKNETLKEIWKKLHPAGEIIIIVPNRNGLWAKNKSTPFGHGNPFSKTHIGKILRKTGFIVTKQETTLAEIPYATDSSSSPTKISPTPSPQKHHAIMRKIIRKPTETVIRRTINYFGGVHIIKAEKQILHPVTFLKAATYRKAAQARLAHSKAISLLQYPKEQSIKQGATNA